MSDFLDEATLALLRGPEQPPVEPGLCGCGCGSPTTRYRSTDKARNQKRGDYARFVFGHRQRLPSRDKPISLVGAFDARDCGFASPCWIWNRWTNTGGYGMGRVQGVRARAHRIIYERLRGPIPDGMQLDHLCRVRACVNPDHLEPVTPAENSQRGMRVKLSPEDAKAIRASSDDAYVIAKRYGVGVDWVWRIRQGYGWGGPLRRSA